MRAATTACPAIPDTPIGDAEHTQLLTPALDRSCQVEKLMGTYAYEVKGSQKNAEPTGTKMSITASRLSNAVLDSSKTQGIPAE